MWILRQIKELFNYLKNYGERHSNDWLDYN